jgi:hypothetical protein
MSPLHRNIEKLKEFLQHKLPPGFPVKVEMPVFPTIKASITFLDYKEAKQDPVWFSFCLDFLLVLFLSCSATVNVGNGLCSCHFLPPAVSICCSKGGLVDGL